jgi:hypothetical protein
LLAPGLSIVVQICCKSASQLPALNDAIGRDVFLFAALAILTI